MAKVHQRKRDHPDQTPLTDKRLRGTAHHEAGHAIVGWLCDHVVGEVTIRPNSDKGSLGSADLQHEGSNDLFEFGMIVPNPNDPEDWVVRTGERTARPLTENERHWDELKDRLSCVSQDEKEVMGSVAGMVAEQKFSPETFEPRTDGGDRESSRWSLFHLSNETGKPVDEVWDEMAARVGELLDDPLVRRVVRALAAALLKEETLSGEAVTQVIRQTVTGPSWSPRPRGGHPQGGRKRA